MRGKKAIGVGYITYPYDVDFFKYRETCFKSRTVSIFTEDSEVYPRVKIGQNLLAKVTFPNPENGELLGSMVVYVRKKNSSIPIVVAVFDLEDRGADLLPGQWKLDLHTESEGVSLVQGMPEDGTLDIIVHSEKSEGSELVLRATSKNKNSKIKIESDSEISILAASKIVLNSTKTEVTGSEELLLKGKDIKIGEKDFEPLVLGSKLEDFLDSVLTIIQGITVPVAPGPIDPGSISKLEQKKLEVGSLLSSVIKVQ